MLLSYPEDHVVADIDATGTTILEASITNRIPHHRECGGHGRCTTCRVRILDGLKNVSERNRREARIARERGWDDATRLACQTTVTGDVTVSRLIRSSAEVSLLQADALQAEQGKEVQAAILMCDIRQFTPFVNAHLPYDVYHILNRFFSGIGEPILLNDGYIYQYVGDQIVGLFGLQGASAQEACLSAVRAGLGMIKALHSLNDSVEAEFGTRLDIRVGAHYGPLIVGFMGHRTRLDFAVIGDAINVASRIESANEALGTTFLESERLYGQVPVDLEEGYSGMHPLKGKEGMHALIEVRGFAASDLDSVVQGTARQLLGDPERFASVFYRRLFEAAPHARALFTGDIAKQGRMLVQAVEMAIYGLSRFHSMMSGLKALGKSHASYGVVPTHYDLFRQILLDTIHEILGDGYNVEVEKAWGAAIDRISNVMRDSTKQHLERLSHASSSHAH